MLWTGPCRPSTARTGEGGGGAGVRSEWKSESPLDLLVMLVFLAEPSDWQTQSEETEWQTLLAYLCVFGVKGGGWVILMFLKFTHLRQSTGSGPHSTAGPRPEALRLEPRLGDAAPPLRPGERRGAVRAPQPRRLAEGGAAAATA